MSEHEKATPRPQYSPLPWRSVVAAVNSYDACRARIEELESEVQQRADDVIQLTGKELASRTLIEQMRDALREAHTRVHASYVGARTCPCMDVRHLIAAAEKFLKEGQ